MLFAFLLVAASITSIEVRTVLARPIVPLDFAHPMSRAEILRIMGSPVVDSFFDFDAHGKAAIVLVFAPTTIAGISSVANVMLANDTLTQADFYQPYRERNHMMPVRPYGAQRFTRAQLDDLVRLRNALTKLYGEPAVMAETSFVYFGGSTVPHMTAAFKDATVVLTIFPSELVLR